MFIKVIVLNFQLVLMHFHRLTLPKIPNGSQDMKSKLSEKLSLILNNKDLLKDLARLCTTYQTSRLESFHSVMIHFAPKLQLAALHFNENTDRNHALTEDRKKRYEIVFPKFKRGGHSVRKVTIDPTYNELLEEVVSTTLPESTSVMVAPADSSPLEPLCSTYDRPDKLEAPSMTPSSKLTVRSEPILPIVILKYSKQQ
uniref:Uncharacterized protein n=1 Tax=Amphimedon queenslandica TaxID=400682 RepID=A0A1X7T9X2_AMPQE